MSEILPWNTCLEETCNYPHENKVMIHFNSQLDGEPVITKFCSLRCVSIHLQKIIAKEKMEKDKQKYALYIDKIKELTDIKDIELKEVYDSSGIMYMLSIPLKPDIQKIDYEDMIADIIIKNFPDEEFSNFFIFVKR